MQYLIAVFIPPCYFLAKKQWLGFIVSSCLLVVSLVLFMTIFLAPIALILWGLCAVVAVWDLRKQLMHEHATVIAEKLAETMQRQAKVPSTPPTSRP